MTWKLAGGALFDPFLGLAGEVGDLYIDGDKFVSPTAAISHTVDCTGRIVFPGGIDIHAHIAGPKVNSARKLWKGSVPTIDATGRLYAGLGYTTVFDAAIPLNAVAAVREEFRDLPIVDAGFYLLVSDDRELQFSVDQPELLRHRLSERITRTQASGLKVVSIGSTEAWKGRQEFHGLDDTIPGTPVTAGKFLRELAHAAGELCSLHIHCHRLGMPGNAAVLLQTMRNLDGARGHFAHVQFHSFGGSDWDSLRSGVAEVADYVNTHPTITVDVGQVMFGKTTAMTADSALAYYLHQTTGKPWYNFDDSPGGCGVMPVVYESRSFVNALQWVMGLEWFLLVKNPWQIALSTDHPVGASFTTYPEIMALLMSHDRRREVMKTFPAKVRERSQLWDLDREYTLSEIAIITRSAPAKILNLAGKGTFQPGAIADLALYSPAPDARQMFENPVGVYKGGAKVVG